MAKRGGFPGGGMPGNMANLMKQAISRSGEDHRHPRNPRRFVREITGCRRDSS